MSGTTAAEAVHASSLAELSWVDGAGAPQVRGVVALVRGDDPALAFTYADADVARDVAAASSLALALRETRSTGAAFRPLLVRGTPRLVEDPRGDLFVDELLTQELRRYPPSRIFADSPLLMREHWWYLPRLVVELDVTATRPIPAREHPDSHLLVVAHGQHHEVRAARLVEQSDQVLVLDVDGGYVDDGPAVLFGQDASFPDLERWSQWRYDGRWEDGSFILTQAPEWTGLRPAPGLMQRWRRQRTLARQCRAAIPGA